MWHTSVRFFYLQVQNKYKMDTSQSKLPSLAYLRNIVVVSVVIWRYYAGIKVLNKKKNVGVMFENNCICGRKNTLTREKWFCQTSSWSPTVEDLQSWAVAKWSWLSWVSLVALPYGRCMQSVDLLIMHTQQVSLRVSAGVIKKKKTLPAFMFLPSELVRIHISSQSAIKCLNKKNKNNKKNKTLQVPLLTWLSGFCNRSLCLYIKVHVVCELILLHWRP